MKKLTTWELVLFALLGTLLLGGDLLMEWLPNVHLVGMLVTVYTAVYRWKAIIPLYIYVLLLGLLNGFALWWIPYLYVWTVLWGTVMLLPRTLTKKTAFAYAAVCTLHGFLFGTLYAPTQVLLFGLPWSAIPAWIAAGLPFDIIHGIGNAVLSLLIYPLTKLLNKAPNIHQ